MHGRSVKTFKHCGSVSPSIWTWPRRYCGSLSPPQHGPGGDMVSKQSDRPYRSGRSRDWVKVQNRRHHAFDRVNRLLQARVDGGDGIDIGHGSSEVDAIAIKRGRDHVVAHHGHALDVHDAARRRVSCPMKMARSHSCPRPRRGPVRCRPGPRSAWSHRRRRGRCRSCPWRCAGHLRPARLQLHWR
jgi:hypothetical protein